MAQVNEPIGERFSWADTVCCKGLELVNAHGPDALTSAQHRALASVNTALDEYGRAARVSPQTLRVLENIEARYDEAM